MTTVLKWFFYLAWTPVFFLGFIVGWTKAMFAFGHRFAIGFFNTDFTK